MSEFLSLHDAEQVAREAAPVVRPGLGRVFAGMIRTPAETLRDAFAHPIQSYAVAYAAAGGVYWALNLAVIQAVGDSASLASLLAGVLVTGLCGGIAYLYAFTILINWSCEILGGQPTRARIRMALAYVGVPGILALVLFGLPKVLIFGHALFERGRPWLDSSPALVWGLWFGDALCFAWSAMLVVKSLKVMNEFSTARAMAAAVLPAAPIVLIGFLFLVIVWSGIFLAPPAF